MSRIVENKQGTLEVTTALNANSQERSATSSGVKRKSVKETTVVTSSSSSSSSNKKGAPASAPKTAPLDGRKKRRCHSAENVKTAASFSESDTSLGESRDLLAPRCAQLQQQSGSC